ncbi:MAG: flagellar protein FlgN [Anaerolineaceae bacterium]
MSNPSAKETTQQLFHGLEAVLVNQFRISQNLLAIVEKEREALVKSDIDLLNKLVEEKELLLDEMGQCENTRKGICEKIAVMNGFSESTIMGDLLEKFHAVTVDRIKRLHEGIQVVQAKIKEINQGNQSLANINLERLDSLQGFLLSLFTPSSYYQPAATPSGERPSATYGVEKSA